MKKVFLIIPLLLLCISCNNSPTGSNVNKPVDTQAKSVQSSPANSKGIVNNNKTYNAGSAKQDSVTKQKADEAKKSLKSN